MFARSAARGQDRESVPTQVLVGTLATGHGQDQKLERTRNLGIVAVRPCGVGGAEVEPTDPPFGSDEEVGVLPTVSGGYQFRLGSHQIAVWVGLPTTPTIADGCGLP